ncbi:hypothetical protein AMTRI_Chr13g84540 [Amborella trichopoda]|uniref:Uncharacterized protein n=1 Tax=Amborella trichopoda TaxID=13333 RepID=W1NJM8_AMBTC|nr:hypothetical protein AMTR_s00129p00030530 [Amborella trichopoda]
MKFIPCRWAAKKRAARPHFDSILVGPLAIIEVDSKRESLDLGSSGEEMEVQGYAGGVIGLSDAALAMVEVGFVRALLNMISQDYQEILYLTNPAVEISVQSKLRVVEDQTEDDPAKVDPEDSKMGSIVDVMGLDYAVPIAMVF